MHFNDKLCINQTCCSEAAHRNRERCIDDAREFRVYSRLGSYILVVNRILVNRITFRFEYVHTSIPSTFRELTDIVRYVAIEVKKPLFIRSRYFDARCHVSFLNTYTRADLYLNISIARPNLPANPP